MLRHLADRPLNLQRFPNGAGAPGFWQKDIPATAPTWLTRWHETGVEGRPDRDANDHLIADRAATLCWLGNQASFEIHAWTGRLPEPWRPTFAYIDIDPGEKTTLEETLVLARLYRTALGHLGVRGYPKTTGKRGIQVWIPIEPRYTFEDTSGWVERVSRAVGSTVPELVSWEWAKGARKGKARLDYTQNASIKTLVAPYAVTARAGSARLRADRLGRAGRPGPPPRPLVDPDHRRARRGEGRPVRRCPDRPPGAAAGLTVARRAWQDAAMHDDTIEIRQPSADPETLRAFLQPVAIAFGDDYTDEMFELDRQLFEMDRLIGAVDGGTWVGGASGESRRLTVPGGAEVRAAAVSGVGVLPTHRRRGILTALMRWILDQAAERGEPVSVLHASEGAIYPHFGYGMGTLQGSIDADRSAFRFSRPAEPLGRVRLVDVDEGMRTIPAIYDQVRAGRPGEVRAHRTSGGCSSCPTTAGAGPRWVPSRTRC